MSPNPYEALADALNRLPNGFPRTPSGVEIPMLQKICTPAEAALASQLCGEMEPVEAIAARVGLSVREARARLMQLVRKGVAWFDREAGTPRFRLAPFVVGIYEAQLQNLDHELAHLVEQYFAEGGLVGIMGPEPALMRVMPAQGTVKSEWILPYEDVRAMLLAAKTFNLRDCICRHQQEHMGRPCSHPKHTCLGFSSAERPAAPGDISQEEALALLDQVEQIGLVHCVSNVMEGMGFVCNCCGCCCGILRGINEYGLKNSVAQANYYAIIAPEACVGCGTCVDRCQVHAIALVDNVAVVDRERCIGCGLCVTGCPQEAARLERKSDAEIIHPPVDYAAWERARLANRGLI